MSSSRGPACRTAPSPRPASWWAATSSSRTCKAIRPRKGARMSATPRRREQSTVTRRDFLRWSALASGGLTAPWAARAVGAQTAPKRGGTLRVGFYIEAATMDPHLSGSKIDRQIYHNIYEPLLTLDANLGIKPGLAETWQLVDAKTLVFKLRRGVKFHDGTDFN